MNRLLRACGSIDLSEPGAVAGYELCAAKDSCSDDYRLQDTDLRLL